MNIRSMGFAAAADRRDRVHLVGQAARADDCDDIVDELKKLTERVINTSERGGWDRFCAATGQLLGITKATREVAAECYEDGRKRDGILLAFDRASRGWKARSTPCASESGHGSIGEA